MIPTRTPTPPTSIPAPTDCSPPMTVLQWLLSLPVVSIPISHVATSMLPFSSYLYESQSILDCCYSRLLCVATDQLLPCLPQQVSDYLQSKTEEVILAISRAHITGCGHLMEVADKIPVLRIINDIYQVGREEMVALIERRGTECQGLLNTARDAEKIPGLQMKGILDTTGGGDNISFIKLEDGKYEVKTVENNEGGNRVETEKMQEINWNESIEWIHGVERGNEQKRLDHQVKTETLDIIQMETRSVSYGLEELQVRDKEHIQAATPNPIRNTGHQQLHFEEVPGIGSDVYSVLVEEGGRKEEGEGEVGEREICGHEQTSDKGTKSGKRKSKIRKFLAKIVGTK